MILSKELSTKDGILFDSATQVLTIHKAVQMYVINWISHKQKRMENEMINDTILFHISSNVKPQTLHMKRLQIMLSARSGGTKLCSSWG
jgi:hypothetical protein